MDKSKYYQPHLIGNIARWRNRKRIPSYYEVIQATGPPKKKKREMLEKDPSDEPLPIRAFPAFSDDVDSTRSPSDNQGDVARARGIFPIPSTMAKTAEPTDSDLVRPRVRFIQISVNTNLLLMDYKSSNGVKGTLTLQEGSVSLTLLSGGVSLNGYVLQMNQKVESVILSKTRTFLSIEPSTDIPKMSMKEIKRILSKIETHETKLQNLLDIIQKMNVATLSIVLMEKLDDNIQVQWMLSYDPKIDMTDTSWNLLSQKPQPFAIGESFERILTDQYVPLFGFESVTLVTGPATSGKSTLIRYILNRMMCGHEDWPQGYDQVYIVDLDPGQTLFTPPGQISVRILSISENDHQPFLSEPFISHLNPGQEILSVSVGSTDVANVVASYIEGVKMIWKAVCNYPETFPVIVNTMGWVKGLGRSILTDIIATILPTVVIELKSSFDGGQDASFESLFHPTLMRAWTNDVIPPPEYDYVQLKAQVHKSDLSKDHNKLTRKFQLMTAFTRNPQVFRSSMSNVDRIPVDLSKMVFCIVSDSGILSHDTITECLHLSFVQLLVANDITGVRTFNEFRVNHKIPSDHKIVGHGIIVTHFRTSSSRRARELVKIEVIPFPANVFEEHEINVLLKPDKVTLPSEIAEDFLDIPDK